MLNNFSDTKLIVDGRLIKVLEDGIYHLDIPDSTYLFHNDGNYLCTLCTESYLHDLADHRENMNV